MATTLHQPAVQELQLLRNQTGKICVSITVPTHRLSPDRRSDELVLEKAVQQAADQLRKHDPIEAEKIISSINQLVQGIDFNHNQEGIGIFVSDAVQLIVQYPFSVLPKIIIDSRFDLKDVLYKATYSKAYSVLHLEKTKTSLYYGTYYHLDEVQDQNFPAYFADEHEYATPARASSYAGNSLLKGYEKDKSALQKVRYQSYLSIIEDRLKAYLDDQDQIILLGDKQNTSLFMNQSHFVDKVAKVVTGNYSDLSIKELTNLIATAIQTISKAKMKQEVKELEEHADQGYAEIKLHNIKEAIDNDRGLKLLVEKDYSFSKSTVLKNDRHKKNSDSSTTANGPEAALIESILDKHGQVVLLDKDMLKKYGHIALITRY